MKKKIFLNLVMGISLIATPALLLASCSAQASDVKLPITKKASPNAVSAEELQVTTITLKTVQKLFNIDTDSFKNVTVALKNVSPVVNQTNQIVLTVKGDFIFENGTNTLESAVFIISNSMLKITVKDSPGDIPVSEIQSITLTTLQKLFNIDEVSFKNVTAKVKNAVSVGANNKIILTANKGFIFTNGTFTLESGTFRVTK